LKVYLAGPDVFLPDAPAWMERKKAICAAHGLEGVSPLDPREGDWADQPEWRQIALRNEAHIRACSAVIANLTPFRGPSADAGTVYEVGFARGLGLPVFGYATVTQPFLDRTLAATTACLDGGAWWDEDGMLVEQFGLFDNLMIEGALTALVTGDADRWRDLSVFERCVVGAVVALA
jgi:hypothetical protein